VLEGYAMRKLKEHRGAAVVEFAIVLVLLLAIVFGIIEFGFLMFNKQVITNAAREGARYGIVKTDPLNDLDDRTPALIQGVVNNYASSHLITLGDGGGALTTSVSGNCTAAESGDPLAVNVTYNYAFLVLRNITSMMGTTTISPVISLSTSAVMNCE